MKAHKENVCDLCQTKIVIFTVLSYSQILSVKMNIFTKVSQELYATIVVMEMIRLKQQAYLHSVAPVQNCILGYGSPFLINKKSPHAHQLPTQGSSRQNPNNEKAEPPGSLVLSDCVVQHSWITLALLTFSYPLKSNMQYIITAKKKKNTAFQQFK